MEFLCPPGSHTFPILFLSFTDWSVLLFRERVLNAYLPSWLLELSVRNFGGTDFLVVFICLVCSMLGLLNDCSPMVSCVCLGAAAGDYEC